MDWLWEMGDWLWDMGDWLWDMGDWRWDMGYWLWDMGDWLWDMGYVALGGLTLECLEGLALDGTFLEQTGDRRAGPMRR